MSGEGARPDAEWIAGGHVYRIYRRAQWGWFLLTCDGRHAGTWVIESLERAGTPDGVFPLTADQLIEHGKGWVHARAAS